MTPEQFVYWLQGYFELADEGRGWSTREHIIRDHLQEVFEKKTPDPMIYRTTSPDVPPNFTGDPFGQNKFIC